MPCTRLPDNHPLPDDHPVKRGAMIVSVGRPLSGEADGDPGVADLRLRVQDLLPEGCTLVRAYGAETMGMAIWAAECTEHGPLHRHTIGRTACWDRWPTLRIELDELEPPPEKTSIDDEDDPHQALYGPGAFGRPGGTDPTIRGAG